LLTAAAALVSAPPLLRASVERVVNPESQIINSIGRIHAAVETALIGKGGALAEGLGGKARKTAKGSAGKRQDALYE
jgi:hypothetical protein